MKTIHRKADQYIVKRRNAYYFVGTVNGKRIRKTLQTDNYAEAVLKAEHILGLTEPSVVPDINQVYFIDAVDSYFASNHDKQNVWRDGYGPDDKYVNGTCILSTLKRLQQFGNITYLHQIEFKILQNFINDVKYNSLRTGSKTKKLDVGNKTLNKHVTRIKGFLTYSVNMKYITANEAALFKKLPESTPDRPTFTDEQIIIILQNAGQYTPFFELMLETGLRACDAMVLTKDNFPNGDQIKFESVKTRVKVNGYISKRAQEIVKSIKTKQLFPWATTKRQKSAPQRTLRKILGKAYCTKNHINTHTFRHTFAMSMYKKCQNMDIVGQFLGHKNISTTKIYAKKLPNDVLKQYLDMEDTNED